MSAREAGAAQARPDPTRLLPRGSIQGGSRQYNERVVLHAIRQHGALPAAEVARLTGLTAQTVSLIAKRLVDEGLVLRGTPQRGKVGQPSVPLSLNPEGAYAIGIKVGRRSLDTLLVDFTGARRERWTMNYAHADPRQVLTEIDQRLRTIGQSMTADQRQRVQGIGIAAPLAMGGWQQLLGLPKAVVDQWANFDLQAQVAALSEWPVSLIKDTAAACVAELVAGRGRQVPSFLYVFVDTFIGGGLVLDSQLRAGRSGNAGALGSMSLGVASESSQRRPDQLLSVASLLNLEQRFAQAGLALTATNDQRALQVPWLPHTRRWLQEASAAIAQAVSAATCLLDLDGVILDGSFDRSVLDELLRGTDEALDRLSWEGVVRPVLMAGTIGSDARALGGALLPLHASFAPDRDVFVKVAEG